MCHTEIWQVCCSYTTSYVKSSKIVYTKTLSTVEIIIACQAVKNLDCWRKIPVPLFKLISSGFYCKVYFSFEWPVWSFIKGKCHYCSTLLSLWQAETLFLLNLLEWHWLIKLYRCQVYNSATHHLHIVLCVHHPSQVSFRHHSQTLNLFAYLEQEAFFPVLSFLSNFLVYLSNQNSTSDLPLIVFNLLRSFILSLPLPGPLRWGRRNEVIVLQNWLRGTADD